MRRVNPAATRRCGRGGRFAPRSPPARPPRRESSTARAPARSRRGTGDPGAKSERSVRSQGRVRARGSRSTAPAVSAAASTEATTCAQFMPAGHVHSPKTKSSLALRTRKYATASWRAPPSRTPPCTARCARRPSPSRRPRAAAPNSTPPCIRPRIHGAHDTPRLDAVQNHALHVQRKGEGSWVKEGVGPPYLGRTAPLAAPQVHLGHRLRDGRAVLLRARSRLLDLHAVVTVPGEPVHDVGRVVFADQVAAGDLRGKGHRPPDGCGDSFGASARVGRSEAGRTRRAGIPGRSPGRGGGS